MVIFGGIPSEADTCEWGPAALTMSLFLLSTALITTLLIPADAFRDAGPNGEPAGLANGRALAYLAHQFLGD